MTDNLKARDANASKNYPQFNEDSDDKDDDVAGVGSDTTVLYSVHQTVDWTNTGFYGPHIRVWWSIPVIWP